MGGNHVQPVRRASPADLDTATPQAQDANGDNKQGGTNLQQPSTEVSTSPIPPAMKSNNTPEKEQSLELHGPYTPHCDTLLSIPEMCELIFLNLDEHDIVSCKCVSHTFKNTIRGSSKLQRRLFLLPFNSISPLYINPMVFRATREGDLKYDTVHKRDKVQRSYLNDSISQYISLDNTTDLGPMAKMFITQPPVDKIILHAQYFEIWNTEYRYRDCWEVRSRDSSGVKVKDVVMGARKLLAKEARKFAGEEGKGLEGGGYGEGMRLYLARVEGRGLVREWPPRQLG